MSTTLAALRHERGLTQAALAEELGLRPSAVGMYETGQRTPRLQMALRIAGYFGLPVDQISFASQLHEVRMEANV